MPPSENCEPYRHSIAIISDIHANAVALDAVLADIECDSVDQIICLGDVAGTGPQPVETLERIQQLECPVVMGNVDETLLNPPKDETYDDLAESDQMFTVIDAWCADQLSGRHETFLQSFDPTVELERPNGTRLFCYHGSPRSHSEEVSAITSEERLDELFETVDADVLAGGHTHFPFARRYKGRFFSTLGVSVSPASGIKISVGFEIHRGRNTQ